MINTLLPSLNIDEAMDTDLHKGGVVQNRSNAVFKLMTLQWYLGAEYGLHTVDQCSVVCLHFNTPNMAVVGGPEPVLVTDGRSRLFPVVLASITSESQSFGEAHLKAGDHV